MSTYEKCYRTEPEDKPEAFWDGIEKVGKHRHFWMKDYRGEKDFNRQCFVPIWSGTGWSKPDISKFWNSTSPTTFQGDLACDRDVEKFRGLIKKCEKIPGIFSLSLEDGLEPRDELLSLIHI